MATLTTYTKSFPREVKAQPMARFDCESGTRFTLRSDGKILRQLRINGKLEHAVIVERFRPVLWKKYNRGEQLGVFEQYAVTKGVSRIETL